MFYSKASRLFRYAYHNTGLALFLAGMLFSSIVSAVLIHGFHVEKPRVSCVVAKRSEGGQILRLWACESPQSARRNPQGKAMLLDITCIGIYLERGWLRLCFAQEDIDIEFWTTKIMPIGLFSALCMATGNIPYMYLSVRPLSFIHAPRLVQMMRSHP
eukprot:5846711-Pyramimonas_sp.AAC.1